MNEKTNANGRLLPEGVIPLAMARSGHLYGAVWEHEGRMEFVICREDPVTKAARLVIPAEDARDFAELTAILFDALWYLADLDLPLRADIGYLGRRLAEAVGIDLRMLRGDPEDAA